MRYMSKTCQTVKKNKKKKNNVRYGSMRRVVKWDNFHFNNKISKNISSDTQETSKNKAKTTQSLEYGFHQVFIFLSGVRIIQK